jgi:DNA anti-recombination protein RmuC
MSAFELLFALLLVCLLLVMVAGVVIVAGVGRRTELHAGELERLRSELALGGQTQDSATGELRDSVNQALTTLEGVRNGIAARQRLDDGALQSLRRLEAVIAGGSSRGVAGENILDEVFRHLPPEMIDRNVWVRGKVCEFGLRLPGGRLLSIDSKWTSKAALEEMSADDLEPARRSQLSAAVEKEVERRVREVAQYIDPQATAPFALAVVPDAAYAVCRAAFAEALRRHVIIVGYSMALPYLLTVYQLHLQFGRSVDMENLQSCLMEVERQVDLLDAALENKLQRAVTMLGNTYQEGKHSLARIRASVHGIQATERLEDPEKELTVVSR